MFTTAISCYSRFWTNDLNFRMMSEQELINYFIQTGACHYLKYDSVRKVGLTLRNPISDSTRYRSSLMSNVADKENRSLWSIRILVHVLDPPKVYSITFKELDA